MDSVVRQGNLLTKLKPILDRTYVRSKIGAKGRLTLLRASTTISHPSILFAEKVVLPQELDAIDRYFRK